LKSSQFISTTDAKDDWHWYDTGAVSYVPKEISDGVGNFTLPQCVSSLNLNYFATTNIFAPGKKFIDIKGPSDVYTPYDVLILGQVADDFTPVGVTRSLKHSLNLRAGQIPLKDINAFVQDMNTGKPVLAPALASLQTGDEQQITDFIASSGYDLSPEALDAVLATADPGPNFDIRQVAGVYAFDAPPDTGYIMKVDPSTGRYVPPSVAFAILNF
jgi:hypothetical protein